MDKIINKLIKSAKENDLENLIYLTKKIKDVKVYNQALLQSCQSGNLNIVKYLIKIGADIHFQDEFPLMISITNNDLDMVKYLVESGADIHYDNESPLIESCSYGYIDIVVLLLESGADIHVQDDIVLIESIIINDNDLVRILINNSANLRAQNDRPLIEAIRNNNHELIVFLVENNADVNAQNGQPLIDSVEFVQDLDIIDFLIQNGSDIHLQDDEAFIKSINLRNLDVIKYLISEGANINAQNGQALINSIGSSEDFDLIKILLENGSNIHAQDDETLIKSIKLDNLNIIKYLLLKGANIHAQNNKVFSIAKSEVLEYLTTLISKKPFKNIRSTCDSSKLTDAEVFKIGRSLSLPEVSRENLCDSISILFKNKSLETKNDIQKCKTETSLLGVDLIDIPSIYFYILKENNNLFCGDIREFIKLKRNPWTNILITQKELDNINNHYNNLTLLIDDLDTQDQETIDLSLTNTIRQTMNTVLQKLQYPNNVNFYVESTEEQLNKFIYNITANHIITKNDSFHINNIPNLENKKLTLANVLNLKISSDSKVISIKLEELYNSIFI